MTTVLALSVSGSVSQLGVIVAIAALVGVAVLSMLAFSQARELKRLRQWGAEASERIAEMGREQAQIAMRAAQAAQRQLQNVQRVTQAATPAPAVHRPGVPAAAGVAAAAVATAQRVAPGATALALTPSSAGTAVAGLAVAGEPPPGVAIQADQKPAAGDLQPPGSGRPEPVAVPAAKSEAFVGERPLPNPADMPLAAAAVDAAEGSPLAPREHERAKLAAAESTAPSFAAEPAAASEPAAPPPVSEPAAASPESQSVPEMSRAPSVVAANGAGALAPAPATAAAVAAGSAGVGVADRSRDERGRAVEASSSASRPMRPPAPPPPRESELPAGHAGGRTRGAATGQDAGKAARGEGRSAPPGARRGSDGAPGATIYRRERSPVRLIAIAGAVLVVVVLAIVLISSSGGSGNGASNQSANTNSDRHAASAHGNAGISPAALHVVVLNATQTNGLAGKIASALKGHGYAQAAALFGTPPGSYSTTIVEYTQGYRAAALGVARALAVSAGDVRPLGSSTAPLSGGASVVVVAGETSAKATPTEGGREGAANTTEAESGGQTAPTEGAAGGETANGGEAIPQSQAAEPGA